MIGEKAEIACSARAQLRLAIERLEEAGEGRGVVARLRGQLLTDSIGFVLLAAAVGSARQCARQVPRRSIQTDSLMPMKACSDFP